MLNILLIIGFHIILGDAAKILGVFPSPLISHQLVFRPLMQALADRGHEVVVITTDPAYPDGGGPENLIEVNIHDISYSFWTQQLMSNKNQGDANDIFSQIQAGKRLQNELYLKQMQSNEVRTVLKDKFDLIFSEVYFRPAVGLSHYFDCPMILISSFGPSYGTCNSVGAPDHPLLYPTLLKTRMDNLTLSEELYEIYADTVFNYNIHCDESKYDNVNKELFPNAPDLKVIEDRIQMMFLYTHPLWERNRPVPQNIVYIYGIQDKSPISLHQDLKSFLDSSRNGVIYFSFGTTMNTQSISPFVIQLFFNVFSKLPYDILWKWDGETFPGKSYNIKFAKWWPQRDLLKHPNLKLFITQGGLSSSFESISGGVPLIGIPMLFDQWLNVENYVFYKIGVRLDLQTLNEENLNATIRRVIEDESYRENVIKIRSLMNDRPESALDRAVWWTEYVLRHGGAKHLRAAGANMPWSEYYEIEIILLIICFTLFVLYSFVNIIKRIVKIIFSNVAKIKIN